MSHEYQLWREDVEMSFLGSLYLLDMEEAGSAAEAAVPDDFWKPSHQIIFTTMRLLVMRGIPLDLVTIKNELLEDGNLDNAGGVGYLIQLGETVPSAKNWEAYLEILKQYTYRRRCEKYAKQILALAFDDCENSQIESYVEGGLPKSTRDLSPILFRDVEMNESDAAVPSHSPFVNDVSGSGGYVKGQVSVVAAGTKGGKTAWMSRSALYAAQKGYKVMYCLLADLNPGQLKNRMFKHITGRKHPNLHDQEIVLDIERLPVECYWHVEHGSSIRDIEVFLNSRKRKGFVPDIVFVDYIQAIDGDSSQSRVGETERISKRLNQIAAIRGFALVVGSQVTVNPDGTLSAKYAKEIEENAALTLQLSVDKDFPETRRKVLAKYNRFGPSNKFIGANWDDQRLLFVEDAL